MAISLKVAKLKEATFDLTLFSLAFRPGSPLGIEGVGPAPERFSMAKLKMYLKST